jgi:hypothetical protein
MIKDILTSQNLWGLGLIICRFYDAYKYYVQSKKIRKLGTAKGHSRDFGNIALGVDIFMLCYFIFKNFDLYMIISTIIMILFVAEYWFTLYWFYPYRMRGCSNFHRPDLWHYFLNSLQPDKYRKRL